MNNSETYKQGYEKGRNDVIEIVEEVFDYFGEQDNVKKIRTKFKEMIE